MIYSIQMMLGLFRFLGQQSLILELVRINIVTIGKMYCSLGQKVPSHNISIKKYKMRGC